MPKLRFALSGDQKFNTLLSIVALLQAEGEIHIDEIAARFGSTRSAIRSMLSTLIVSSFQPRNDFEQIPFNIDLDRVDEGDGMVSLVSVGGTRGVPRITTSQAAAILGGLSMLRQLPEFEKSEDISHLESLLTTTTPTNSIDVVPRKIDSDLSVLRSAILNGNSITCEYVNGKGESSVRQIDPLMILTSNREWYLRGFCRRNRDVRHFRLDKMMHATELDEVIDPMAYQLGSKFSEADPIYRSKPEDTEVTLELDPEAYQLAALFGKIPEPTNPEGAKIRVKISMAYLPDLGPLIIKYAGRAKVIEPDSAREIVSNYAQHLLNAEEDVEVD